MIETWDGQSLCSTRAPVKEAGAWIAQQKLTRSPVIVLGAGAGYHLRLLVESFQGIPILVVDHRSELLEQVLPISAELKGLLVQNEAELWSSKLLCNFVQLDPQISIFGPAVQSDRKFYEHLSLSLRGQTELGFSKRAQLSGFKIRWSQIPNEFHIKNVMENEIQTQDISILKKIRVLRELVE